MLMRQLSPGKISMLYVSSEMFCTSGTGVGSGVASMTCGRGVGVTFGVGFGVVDCLLANLMADFQSKNRKYFRFLTILPVQK